MTGIFIRYEPSKGELLPGKPFTVRVPHPGDPSTGRSGKDYFIRCNSEGYSEVNPHIFDRLKEAAKGGFSPLKFSYGGENPNPTTQTIGDGKAPIADQHMMRQIADAVRTIDPRTKYNDIRFKPSRPRLRLHQVRAGGVLNPDRTGEGAAV
ncbi:MAG: hypothetical protein V3U14_13055 [candidate division NC10 bacterium]